MVSISEVDSSQEKHERPPERKLSTSEEPRVRTRSFNSKGTMCLTREYVGDAMDQQLSTRNLVKKSIPRDNAIFRAVCEQISSVQTDHRELRSLVEQILSPITQQRFKDGNFDRDKEILKILADITSSRIIVYRSHSDEPEVYEGAEMIENREIHVCETPLRGVYEPVYSAEIHEALAISQSIVYRTLYEDVFKYPKGMIDKMITYIRDDNDKHAKSTIDQVYIQCDQRAACDPLHPLHSANAPCSARPPSVPFCVCKSLDPSIYRNVEYSLYKKKSDDSERAAQNSLTVRFQQGSRCQARDGAHTRYAIVEQVLKPDLCLVRFEHNNVFREFNVADLRPVPQEHRTHTNMHSLLNGTGRGTGGGQQMAFLPGCMPPPPPPPPPMSMSQQFVGAFNPARPPPPFAPLFGMVQPMGLNMGVPPPSSPFFSPPPMYEQQPVFQFNDQMIGGGGGQQPPPPPPPTPMEREKSMGYSPPPTAESPLDNSVFLSTPVSSGRRDKKPRALSAELTDSPTTGRPGKKPDSKKSDNPLTWYKMPQKQNEEMEKRKGGRRATEGDTVGEMKPLQPKQHRLSTCGSHTENDGPSLPSLMDPPMHQMQQLQLQGAQAAAAAARANLPSLLPLPPAQARPSYYASSEWTGSDTVFKEGEGTASQMSLVNNRDGVLLSSCSTEAQQPPMAFPMMGVMDGGGRSHISAPNFSMQEFYDLVRKDAAYSENREGADLPDMPTTRFFYNLGLQFYNDHLKDSVFAPPAEEVPMPPSFSVTSPSMPPPSPAFFPDNMPIAMFHPSAAPPNTPAVSIAAPLMNPYLYQYVHPRVEGMPPYGYMMDDGRGDGQMMNQGPMQMVQSPSPLMSDGMGQIFFPPN